MKACQSDHVVRFLGFGDGPRGGPRGQMQGKARIIMEWMPATLRDVMEMCKTVSYPRRMIDGVLHRRSLDFMSAGHCI